MALSLDDVVRAVAPTMRDLIHGLIPVPNRPDLTQAPPPPPADDPIPGVDLPPRFERSCKLTLAHEGGYVDHPRDPGGATNLGISLRYARTRGSLFDLDGDGDVDADDIRRVTEATAAPAYYADFWKPARCDDLPAGLDHAVFDCSVNSGAGRAVRLLQHTVGAAPDGAFGPKTAAAVAEAVRLNGVPAIARLYCDYRLSYLMSLATWPTFGDGWRNRVGRVQNEAIILAQGGVP